MKTLEIAKNITLFFIVLTIIIAFISYKNNKFNLSTYEILVVILLFSITISIHYIITFLEEFDYSNILQNITDIYKKISRIGVKYK
jgi:hypothetical protein